MQLFNIQIFGSWMTILIIVNEEMNDVMKIIKSSENAIDNVLIKGVSKAIENEAKNKQVDFSACY